VQINVRLGQSKMDNPEKLVHKTETSKTQHNLCIIIYIGIGAFELFIYNVLYKLYCL
jgi:hypothetical protein